MSAQPAHQFDRWRRYLTGVAYRMLGSVTEAEDVVQDAYLRWHDADHLSVTDVRAYLTTVTSRLCLDRLRSAHRQRETYVGPWLPEPLLEAPDTSVDAEALTSRARKRVQAARPRYQVTAGEHSQLTDRFFDAARSGDVSTLKVLLSENATLHTDGGGKRIAARRLIFGADKIGRFFEGLARKSTSLSPRWVNPVVVSGRPGWLTIEQDGLPQVMTLDVAEDRVQ